MISPQRHVLVAAGTLLLGMAVQAAALAQTSGRPDPAATLANKMAWALRIGKAVPVADDTVYVLIHFSKDCPYCTKWRREPAGLGNAKTLVATYPKVEIFIVDRDSLGAPERPAQYPPQLMPEYARRANAGELTPGVPLFEIYLRQDRIYAASGLDAWVDRIIPAIIAMEERREGASKGTATEAAQ